MVDKSEALIQQETRLAASQIPGCVLWRNNVGAYKVPGGRLIEYGLCTGSSDLIGLQSIIVTPQMVGQTIAQFLAIECKTRQGRVSPEQENFLNLIASYGGKSLVVRDASRLKEFMSK